MAKPFVHWVGGKGRLLSKLVSLVPKDFDEYAEPFVGGGAIFFALEPSVALLSDLNYELVTAYWGIRDCPRDVHEILSNYLLTEEFYYDTRGRNYKVLSSEEVAARMIYLNRTCYNGLYRVNADGQFNVPVDRKKLEDPSFPSLEDLEDASRVLRNAVIAKADYEEALTHISSSTFVFLDPPYYGLYNNYTSPPFNEVDHRHLARVCRRLDANGVRFMLTNRDCPAIRELYGGFNFTELEVTYVVGQTPGSRRKNNELVVRNYGR